MANSSSPSPSMLVICDVLLPNLGVSLRSSWSRGAIPKPDYETRRPRLPAFLM